MAQTTMPATVDTFKQRLTGKPGMTELDRLFETVDAIQTALAGLTATSTELNQSAGVQLMKVAKVALGHADTAGGVLSWAAPAACFVVRVILDVTTKATGACTVDVGTTAASATTLSDNLIDGADVGTAVGAFDNYVNASTNGIAMQRLAAGKWVTGSMASGAAAGLVGFAYICFVLV